MANRTINIRTMKLKKFTTFKFTDFWLDIFGEPEQTGLWIISGKEKNGKTTISLKIAEKLSEYLKVLYVSAEEGISKTFVDSIERAKLNEDNNNLQFIDYISIDDLSLKLKQRRSAKVIFLDNLTIYKEELRAVRLKKFIKEHSDKLIIIITHEERNEPEGRVGQLVKKLSQIIMRVQGLKCFISGRCPGGTLTIDEEQSILYHGTEIE